MIAARDGQRHGQVGQPDACDGEPDRAEERGARRQPVAVVDEVAQAGRPALRVDTGRQRQRVPISRAHPREVATLGGPAVVLAVVLDVAHDLDVGGRAPQPRLLGREDARAVQVDAAGPCREGGDGARRGNFAGAGRSGGERTGRRSERDRERPEQAGREPEAAVLAWACHASILPQDAGSCHDPVAPPLRRRRPKPPSRSVSRRFSA